MKYREMMSYLDECLLGVILLAGDKRITEHNKTAERLLQGEGTLKDKPVDLVVRFIPMDDGIVYANVGMGRYIKQCPTPEIEDLPPESKLIVFRDATKDILYEMMLKVVNKLKESVIVCDAYSRILLLNEAASTMDSIPVNKVFGMPIGSMYLMNSDSYLAIPKVIEDKKPLLDLRQRYTTMYGKDVDIVSSNYPIIEGGQTLGGFSVMQDWTQIDELNRRIIDLQSKLVEKNYPGTKHKPGQALAVKYRFKDIIHISSSMRKVIENCRQVAKSDSSVMIYGETGTGKEMISQSIHGASKRADKSFIAINCAAIPENLLESMLFGTEKGAYTGAERREGLFEQATGGTLLLDEINSMNIGLQSKLLRVLQDGVVRRVGGNTEIRVDVRVLSNINMPPDQAISENRLRRDLFYRLGVVNINLPPLRVRKDDIPLLTNTFIQQLNKKHLKNIADVDAATMELFLTYDWPGNVRELYHVIEHAMNVVPEDTCLITPDHVPEHISGPANPALAPNGEANPDGSLSLNQILGDVKTRVLTKALQDNGGNISKTARALGLSRQNLQYRLKKLKVKFSCS
ncbi:MAG: sigma 54-interacting transcriptional regulator [Deltaproteobacteria bacterium]|jgi:arginine utilization regulatory protein|nr:sigma 54-interacting transcriptional regulator [Deltaproteobacteria bacterium]